jgi:hypothetical protein
MSHKRVRTVKLFCSLDRTPFVSVSATLFAIFVFTVVLIAGRPRIGGLDLFKVNNPIYEPDANKEDAIALAVFYDGRIFLGGKTQYRLVTCYRNSVTVWDAAQKPRYT